MLMVECVPSVAQMKFVSKYEYKAVMCHLLFSTFSILRGEYGIGVRIPETIFLETTEEKLEY